MMLNLQTYEPLPEIAPTRPEKRKNPVVAMLLSIVFPGLGHLYLGSRRNAAWIAGFELLKPWPLQVVIDNVLGGKPVPIAALASTSPTGLLLLACFGIIVVHLGAGALTQRKELCV